MQSEIPLQVLPALGGCEPTLPTAKVVRDFERDYSMLFPQSYVDFIRRYGPGELNRWVRIHVPRVTKKSMLTLEELMSETDDLAHALSGSFVPFATTGGGDTFYWRFREPTNKRKEHPIYYQERMSEDRILFSKTFDAFVNSVCAGKRLGIERERVYQPFGKPLMTSQLSKLVSGRLRETLELLAKKGNIKRTQGKSVNRIRR